MDHGGVYIAGPMRGYPAYNFETFFEVEKAIKRKAKSAAVAAAVRRTFIADVTEAVHQRLVGVEDIQVFNPARNDIEKNSLEDLLGAEGANACGQYLLDNPGEFDLRAALKDDLWWITSSAAHIVLLPGWEASAGARAEVALATALGITVWFANKASNDEWEFREALYSDLPLLDLNPDASADRGETRMVSETGGEKGVKTARFDLLPWEALELVAEHFGKGARKYADHNWRRGYPWSRSYGALGRHLSAHIKGEEYDTCPEDGHGCRHTDMDGKPFVSEPGTCFNHTGSLHIVAAAWHALVLIEFYQHHQDYDDRWIYDKPGNSDRFKSAE